MSHRVVPGRRPGQPTKLTEAILNTAAEMTELVFTGQRERFSERLGAALGDCASSKNAIKQFCHGGLIACGTFGCAFSTNLLSPTDGKMVIKVAQSSNFDVEPGGDLWSEAAVGLMVTALIDAEMVPPFAVRTYAILVCKGADVPLIGCDLPAVHPRNDIPIARWTIERAERAFMAVGEYVRGRQVANPTSPLEDWPPPAPQFDPKDPLLFGRKKDELWKAMDRKRSRLWNAIAGRSTMASDVKWRRGLVDYVLNRVNSTTPPTLYTIMSMGAGPSIDIKYRRERISFFLLLAGGLCSAYRGCKFTHSDTSDANVMYRNASDNNWRGRKERGARFAVIWLAKSTCVIPISGRFPFLIDMGNASFVPPCTPEAQPWTTENLVHDRKTFGSSHPGSTAVDLAFFAARMQRYFTWDELNPFLNGLPGGMWPDSVRWDWKLTKKRGRNGEPIENPDGLPATSEQLEEAIDPLIDALADRGARWLPSDYETEQVLRNQDVLDWR